MQTLNSTSTVEPSSRGRLFVSPRTLKIISGTLLVIGAGLWLIFNGSYNLVAAAIYISLFSLVAYWNKTFSLFVVAAYTYLLGDLRRIMDFTGEIPKLDPLLLVTPIFSLAMATPVLMDLQLIDPIQKAVVALMVIMTIEIFNPIQGPLIVGMGGAMTYLIPMCWFWLGWRYGNLDLLRRLIALMVWLGVVAAILGLIQTYVGYLPWEQAWLQQVGSHIHSMYLGAGVLRAIGFSVNGVEFTALLTTSLVASVALFFAGKRTFLLLAPLLAFALFLGSSRTSILLSIFGMAIAWSVSNRNPAAWGPRLIFALILGIAALGFSVTHVAGTAAVDKGDSTNSAAELSTQHQVQGLAHPFDAKRSTANMHGQMLLGGILNGFRNPIGWGLGSTFATGKLGGDSASAGSSEVDISDMFLTTGLIGGLLYIMIIVLVFKRTAYFARNAQKELSLPVASVLASLFGGWLMAGRYGQNVWLWMVIGIICRYGSKNVPMKDPKFSHA